MRRREFITLLGGTAAIWPFAARAQPVGSMRLIGVLMGWPDSFPRAQSWLTAFPKRPSETGLDGRHQS
jgi:putative tryptophan/tyrosine transport system substrate-binding protein